MKPVQFCTGFMFCTFKLYRFHVLYISEVMITFIENFYLVILEHDDLVRVPTRQGKVREIWFFFKVREKSGNSVKWSGRLENLQKSGNFKIMLG